MSGKPGHSALRGEGTVVTKAAPWSSSLLTPKLEPRVAGAVEVQARTEDGWPAGLVFGLEVLNPV